MIVCLTGPARVGKSQFISALVHNLQNQDINVEGFYTEPYFDDECDLSPSGIVATTLDYDDVEVFAQKRITPTRFQFKKFYVDIEALECVTLPVLQGPYDVMIIDELTKLATFSDKFKEAVEKIMNQCRNNKMKFFIVTVPLKTGDEFIKKLITTADEVLCLTPYNNLRLFECLYDSFKYLMGAKRRKYE